MRSDEVSSPLSFPVDVRMLPKKGMPVRIVADERQRIELARDHALEAVDELEADLLVQPWRGDGVKVTGRVSGRITQACIVTLQPLHATIDEPVEALFVPAGSRLAKPRLDEGGEMLLSPDGADAPEIYENDSVDVGALAEEFFALGIDPYPRAGGASEASTYSTGQIDEAEENPFAKLRDLSKGS